MTERRFFLAHAKSDDSQKIAELLAQARAAIDPVCQGKPYAIITGRDYFEQRFKLAGSWEAWAAEVANGVDYITRAPLFHAILVPAGAIGSGTAKIIECALAAGKAVFAFRMGTARVVKVICAEPGNRQTGHRLVVDKQLS